ncbi:MAG: cobalt transporter CbiM [Chloroflexota bacterium]
MHIPDGYLSPLMSLGAAAFTVPAWAIAVRRVQAVLNNRTVPLLAIFAAFTFTIMMFNIPVPGGTTAHGVGGTLIAIVLGPAAAVIGVSMALILQALFFGDGGVLAIFINCLNMGVILPLAGYYTYRIIAGNSPLLGTRRVWAAGIGAYVGLTISAIAVAVELGLQPLFFSSNGQALYSPYGLEVTLPSMLISHLFGASIVEAIISALGVAYLQKRHPEYLTSLKSVFAGPGVMEGKAERHPLGQVVALIAGGGLVIMLVAGLITGGGDISRMFGADWSQVDWASVASMLLVVAIIAALLIPLAYFLLPKRMKGIGTAFVALAIIAPLGLIAPGFAFGEGSADDVQAAFGYVPKGIQDMSSFFSAPLASYNIPIPFFSDAEAPLWHAAIGYEIAGIVGMLMLGALVFGLANLLRRTGGRSSTSAARSDVRSDVRVP